MEFLNKFKKQSLLLILGVGFIVGFVKNVHAQKGKDTVAVVLTPEQMQEDLDSLKSLYGRFCTTTMLSDTRPEPHFDCLLVENSFGGFSGPYVGITRPERSHLRRCQVSQGSDGALNVFQPLW